MISAEVRWFWPSIPPLAFTEWFLTSPSHPFPAGGGQSRQDNYLGDPTQTELGIKARGGKPGVEVKGLVAHVAAIVSEGPFRAQPEIWTKWTSNALRFGTLPQISTNKTRWMRKFDTTAATPREIQLGDDEEPRHEPRPASGCNVELTRIDIGGKTVWTFGFESFGELELVDGQLRAVAALLAERNPPDMGDAATASYPVWLSVNAHTFSPG